MRLHSRIAQLTAHLGFLAMLATTANLVQAEPASEGVAAVADALHAAISAGDSKLVYDILAPDVLIFESGGVESSLAEYASHHMLADMDFMNGMQREVLDRDVFEAENLAVVSTRSRLTGSFRDETVDISSTETLMLGKTEEGWKIRHIHWSSRSAQ